MVRPTARTGRLACGQHSGPAGQVCEDRRRGGGVVLKGRGPVMASARSSRRCSWGLLRDSGSALSIMGQAMAFPNGRVSSVPANTRIPRAALGRPVSFYFFLFKICSKNLSANVRARTRDLSNRLTNRPAYRLCPCTYFHSFIYSRAHQTRFGVFFFYFWFLFSFYFLIFLFIFSKKCELLKIHEICKLDELLSNR